jgi:hypothetical protein
MPECVHADLEYRRTLNIDDEYMLLLLLKPRSLSITIFLIVSEKGIATSETQKPTHTANCTRSIPKTWASWLLGPVSMVAIHLIIS